MGKRKRTPVKRVARKGRPRKSRPVTPIKGSQNRYIGHDLRMAIALLAKAGKSPSEIADGVGCNYKTAVKFFATTRISWCKIKKRWSDRKEEVFKSGSVASKPKAGRTPIYNTPEKQKKLYKKLRRSNVSKLSRYRISSSV